MKTGRARHPSLSDENHLTIDFIGDDADFILDAVVTIIGEFALITLGRLLSMMFIAFAWERRAKSMVRLSLSR